ncbi:MAG: sulfur carrier protein ThiS [Pseudomonadota bacterium]|jgi:sulfur carrier protein
MKPDHNIAHKLMAITVNGEVLRLPAGATVADAAQARGVQPPFAAAVNMSFVPRPLHGQTLLDEGDVVELISPITGG